MYIGGLEVSLEDCYGMFLCCYVAEVLGPTDFMSVFPLHCFLVA